MRYNYQVTAGFSDEVRKIDPSYKAPTDAFSLPVGSFADKWHSEFLTKQSIADFVGNTKPVLDYIDGQLGCLYENVISRIAKGEDFLKIMAMASHLASHAETKAVVSFDITINTMGCTAGFCVVAALEWKTALITTIKDGNWEQVFHIKSEIKADESMEENIYSGIVSKAFMTKSDLTDADIQTIEWNAGQVLG